jgi:hypothetical protein
VVVPVEGRDGRELEIDAAGAFTLAVRGPWSDEVVSIQGLAIVGEARQAAELALADDQTGQLLPWVAGSRHGVVEVILTTGPGPVSTVVARKRLTDAGLVNEGAAVRVDNASLRLLGVAHGLAFLHEVGTSDVHTLALEDGAFTTASLSLDGATIPMQLGSVLDASPCGGKPRVFLGDLSSASGDGAILGLAIAIDGGDLGEVTAIPQSGARAELAGVAGHGSGCLQGQNLGVLTLGLSQTGSTQTAQSPLATTTIAVFDDVTAVPEVGAISRAVEGVLPARGLPVVPGVDAEGRAHDAMGIVAVTRGFDVALLSLRVEEDALVLGDIEAVLPAPPLALVAVRRGEAPSGVAALLDVDGPGALLHVLGSRRSVAPRFIGAVPVPCNDPERCDLVALDVDGDDHDELVVLAGLGAAQQLVMVRLVPAP